MAAGDTEMDMVADLLGGGRTVAYKAVLAHACGGATVGLLLSQFWYWSNQESVRERDGWFWKVMEEITAETGLTRSEQESARRKLREAGILLEAFRDLPRKLYFKIDKKRLYEVLRDHARQHEARPAPHSAGFPHYGGGESRAMERRKPARSSAGKPRAFPTEKTAETTSKRTAADGRLPGSPRTVQLPKASAAEKPNGSEPDSGDALVSALTAQGLNRSDAVRLAAASPDECRRQLDYLPHVAEFKSSKGAYLRTAIEQGFAPPPGYERLRKARETDKNRRRQGEKTQADRLALQAREGAQRALLEAEKQRLQREEPETWARVMAEAEALLPPPLRAKPAHVAYHPALQGNIDRILATVVQTA